MILALWGTPRSSSTAFEWMMRTRGDCVCYHEPFGEAWYQGEEPKWTRITPEHTRIRGLTSQSVWQRLTSHGDKQVFIKDFPMYIDHLWNEIDLTKFQHTFIIRDPAKVATSMYKHWPEFLLKEIGFVEQRELFDHVCEITGKVPVVIDSDDLLEDPAGMVEAYCNAVGIPFMPEALSWEIGPRTEVDWWFLSSKNNKEVSWHGNLQESTGLKAQPRNYIDIADSPDRVKEIYQACLPHYEYMHKDRLVK
jgi:hypothetical protein